MESSSARSNASVENRLGYARSTSMDSASPSLAARSGSMLSRRSSRQGSRGSISLSREMGDSILNSMRHSLQSADQMLGDIDSSVEPYKLSMKLDYAAYMIHLAVFGFFGVFTRYGLQKLFGPDCLALTSDQSPLYPDLPSNMADIRHISDHLIVGITTGYMGSLTTFSGWNQKMVGLSSKGHWVYAVAGIVLVNVRNLADGAVLWMGCSVAPPGVWLRWYLARLNGQGIGKQGSFKWLPVGTLAANVLAAGIMAALAVTSKAVHTKQSTVILSGIQLGFLGCLSTVSTFAAEVYTM
ncbi:hypothetical protein HU200_041947 [Digitaria exilis]|uniref:Uncharacterized protein n=1 Tax=Digitaria exilis TaxID=1010633 RepID=A0A835EHD4_9POAL|nr:hypothetical protein HU200_041947 [Digitaria exilis]